jgi:hypothetical protein
MIWVEWDSGYKNCYGYHEGRNAYDIKPVNEPRTLVDDLIAVGCKVLKLKILLIMTYIEYKKGNIHHLI